MEKYYRERYKNYTLEQLLAEQEKVQKWADKNLEEYQANIKKSSPDPEVLDELNREEKELVYNGVRLREELEAISELIEEAKAKLQMQ